MSEAESFSAEQKLKRDSCCCGATKTNPCACMIQGVMKCDATCPCSLEKKAAESFEADAGDNCPYCYCEHKNLSVDSQPPYFDGEVAWVEIQCHDCNMKATAPTYDFEFENQGILEDVGLPIAVNMENPNYGTLRCSRCYERVVRAAESFSAEGIKEREYTASGDYKWLKGIHPDGQYFTIVNSGRGAPYAWLHDTPYSWKRSKDDRKLPLIREGQDEWEAKCEYCSSHHRFPDAWCMFCASGYGCHCECDDYYAESFSTEDFEQVSCSQCGRLGWSDEMEKDNGGYLCARCARPDIDWVALDKKYGDLVSRRHYAPPIERDKDSGTMEYLKKGQRKRGSKNEGYFSWLVIGIGAALIYSANKIGVET